MLTFHEYGDRFLKEGMFDWLWGGGGQPGMPSGNDPKNLTMQTTNQAGNPQAYANQNAVGGMVQQSKGTDASAAGGLQYSSPTKQAMANINNGFQTYQKDPGTQRLFKKYPQLGQQLQAVQKSWTDFVGQAKKVMDQVNAQTPQAGRNMGNMSGGNNQSAGLPLARPTGTAPAMLQRTQ